MDVPFNKPYITGNELTYIQEAIEQGNISGDGAFTKKCQELLKERYGFKECLLTTSCTDALELAALLLEIGLGDEVIVPSYTFVSTANAFVLRGAKVVFADSSADGPNVDAESLRNLVTPQTKAIVVVHYAGIPCDMDAINAIAEEYGLYVVEDAAHALDASYKGKPAGTLGHLAAFSFHATKNVIAGEGGALVINDERFVKRAEVLREKGTNRSAFLRGEIDKYEWVDAGSSFAPSELNAAFLFAQLQQLDAIQQRRRKLWQRYYTGLRVLEVSQQVQLPFVPEHCTHSAHVFYLVCASADERIGLINHLKGNGIQAVFHYLSLHKSPFYLRDNAPTNLPNTQHYSYCLVRLPLYHGLTEEQVDFVVGKVLEFYV
ncbi:dTDP-4-amino-4,6-dideoxygalactose transaminase [soil metagenome]